MGGHLAMMCIKHPPMPDAFRAESEAEAILAAEFYGKPENAGQTYDFKAYKNPAGVKALHEAYDGKCAYCESRYAATAPMDVEHYRPKGAVVINGKLVKPGYWWLAADWDNLLPSCIDCNRARTQELVDDSTQVMGKANKFPIKDEAKRAKKPGDHVAEEPLLLYPCGEVQIAKHLRFDDEGLVHLISPEGRETDKTVGLNRKELVLERRRRIIEIKHQMKVVNDNLQTANLIPPGPGRDRIKSILREEIAYLKGMVHEKAIYSALAHALVDPFLKSLSA